MFHTESVDLFMINPSPYKRHACA